MVNKDFQKVKSQLAGSGGILWRLPAQLVVLTIHYEFRFRTRNKSHVRFCFLCISNMYAVMRRTMCRRVALRYISGRHRILSRFNMQCMHTAILF